MAVLRLNPFVGLSGGVLAVLLFLVARALGLTEAFTITLTLVFIGWAVWRLRSRQEDL